MIRFLGDLTGESKKYLLKRHCMFQLFVWLIATSIIGVPIVALALSWKIIVLWCYIAYVVIFMVVCLLPPSKQARSEFMPKEIFIDFKEEMIVQKSEKKERFHELSSIKCIYDYGEWYYITFCFGNKDQYFLCQKSLLIEGSLDDFEKFFEDRLVKRTKNK